MVRGWGGKKGPSLRCEEKKIDFFSMRKGSERVGGEISKEEKKTMKKGKVKFFFKQKVLFTNFFLFFFYRKCKKGKK